MQAAKRISDTKKAIETIFNKILAWKRKAGNLDDQEKMVARKLIQSSNDPVQLHNAKTLKKKLAEFTDEIGLKADEVTLLVFTSIDQHWFTNMIVMAGDFTNWFNINFAGESREEVDFRDNKIEIW